MKSSKYTMEKVEKDFQYYKDNRQETNASIYYMLKNRYREQMEYAQQRLNEEIIKEEGENK